MPAVTRAPKNPWASTRPRSGCVVENMPAVIAAVVDALNHAARAYQPWRNIDRRVSEQITLNHSSEKRHCVYRSRIWIGTGNNTNLCCKSLQLVTIATALLLCQTMPGPIITSVYHQRAKPKLLKKKWTAIKLVRWVEAKKESEFVRSSSSMPRWSSNRHPGIECLDEVFQNILEIELPCLW